MEKKHFKVMVCAGEVSGDMYAASIIQEIKNNLGDDYSIEFFGIGGDKMEREGVKLYAHVSRLAVIGIWEVMKNIRFFSNLLKDMKKLIDDVKPDMLVTIDYPGFNMRLAEYAHNAGVKTVHYICPQVWAWHKERIPKIAKIFDKLITIFPFEPKLFDDTGLDVSFTGHPLVDCVDETKRESKPNLPWGKGKKIAIFPGSRKNEIVRLLPVVLEAACLLEDKVGECSFIIPIATEKNRAIIDKCLSTIPRKPKQLEFVDGNSRHILLQADAAIVKSGTSTMEAALTRCPHILIYKISQISFAILKRLVKGVSHVGIVNIVANRSVTPELLQEAVNPTRIVEELLPLLSETDRRKEMLRDIDEVINTLGGCGAIKRTADAIREVLLK